MGLLGDIYSAGDTMKRRFKGLLDEPAGTLALGVTRFGEDQNSLLNLMRNAYPMAGDKTVLNSPQQIATFRSQLADKGAEQAMAGTVWHGAQAGKPSGLLGIGENTAMTSKTPSYQIDHKPMTVEGGAAPLHDLAKSFGEDVYGKNALQYYGSGDAREKYALQVMNKVKGNPDAKVTIYRGVPDGVKGINAGDWVTIHPDVAKDYGKVVKMEVPASDITSWSDSLLEFGYYPKEK